VNIVNSGVDYRSAPADYADLFRIYYPYVVLLVKRAGVDPQNAEDVASEILLRFQERDFLNAFDPTLTFEYQGELRPARFKSFLSKFVLVYTRGLRDRYTRQNTREMQIIDDMWDADDPAISPWRTWVSNHTTIPGHEDDVVACLVEESIVAEMRAYLATIPRRSRFDTCNLVALFDAMVDQVRRTGTYSATDLRRIFGVSSTAMHTWIRWLRINLANYLGRSLPEPKPRRRAVA
jgi:hypothetical protein